VVFNPKEKLCRKKHLKIEKKENIVKTKYWKKKLASEWKLQQTTKKGKIHNMREKCFDKLKLILTNQLILLDAEIKIIENNQGFIETTTTTTTTNLQKRIFN
jgi:hypothetical protein